MPTTYGTPNTGTSLTPGDFEQQAIKAEKDGTSWVARPVLERWTPLYSKILLIALVLCCLLPFIGKAFNIDDPAFIWQAKQIAQHPLKPYGFNIVWDLAQHPFWQIDLNPPLVSYYGALVGVLAGWSEQALHLAFLLPAMVLVLGTYRLARRFTNYPLVAATAAFLSPAVLVSGTSVMTDTTMAAIWVLASNFWIEGIETGRPLALSLAVSLMAACALANYFGMSLIPLAFAYAFLRKRRVGIWAGYLLVPMFVMAGYEFWTHTVFGRGFLLDAFRQIGDQRVHGLVAKLKNILVSLSFTGGAMLPALFFAPILWSRKQMAAGAVSTVLFAAAVHFRFINLGLPVADPHWSLSLQLACLTAGGISIVALLISDFLERKDADSVFLALWVLGTLTFVAFLNWTVNVRTILPLIPAVGILLARRLERLHDKSAHRPFAKIVIPLALSGFMSLWIAMGDASLANSARTASQTIQQITQNTGASVLFEGHWGFQYYMELSGAHPVDLLRHNYRTGDFLVIPRNNSNVIGPLPGFRLEDGRIVEVSMHGLVTLMYLGRGAGFYSSLYGPLPYEFGPVPPEQYFVGRLAP